MLPTNAKGWLESHAFTNLNKSSQVAPGPRRSSLGLDLLHLAAKEIFPILNLPCAADVPQDRRHGLDGWLIMEKGVEVLTDFRVALWHFEHAVHDFEVLVLRVLMVEHVRLDAREWCVRQNEIWDEKGDFKQKLADRESISSMAPLCVEKSARRSASVREQNPLMAHASKSWIGVLLSISRVFTAGSSNAWAGISWTTACCAWKSRRAEAESFVGP